MSPRVDRYGEPLEADEASPVPTLWDETPAPGVAAPEHRPPPIRCELCDTTLEPANWTGWCRECELIVSARLRIVVEERWRDHPDGEHVVSERGRIARLLNVDRAHRYPRVSIASQKVYIHHLVAEAWHGPRPDGAQALHWDDDPENLQADNIRWGTPVENVADARRNGRRSRSRSVAYSDSFNASIAASTESKISTLSTGTVNGSPSARS